MIAQMMRKFKARLSSALEDEKKRQLKESASNGISTYENRNGQTCVRFDNGYLDLVYQSVVSEMIDEVNTLLFLEEITEEQFDELITQIENL